jgi:hypothetical protein
MAEVRARAERREGVRRKRNGGGSPLPAHARGDKLPPTWDGAWLAHSLHQRDGDGAVGVVPGARQKGQRC